MKFEMKWLKTLGLSIFFAFALSFDSYYAQAQVLWTDAQDWEMVKAKAERENKLIFVDCTAEWCPPCRKMETEVFSQTRVADLMNKHFVSLKLQMDRRLQIDTTKYDNRKFSGWPNNGTNFSRAYNIRSIPTYLIFNSDGELVHRDAGGYEVETFVKLLEAALNDGRTYSDQLLAWRTGGLDFRSLPLMILKAEKLNQNATAKALARDGINYLSDHTNAFLYNKGLIRAIGPYVEPSDKTIFGYFYPESKGKITDSLMNTDKLSKAIADLVIKKDINSFLIAENDWTKPKIKNPDWEQIETTFASKYDKSSISIPIAEAKRKFMEMDIRNKLVSDGDWQKPISLKPDWNRILQQASQKYDNDVVASQLIYDAKKKFYSETVPDQNEWARIVIANHNQYIASNSTDENFLLAVNNDMFYGVFEKVSNKKILAEAAALELKVVEYAELKASDNMESYVDTYANLLYKSGIVKAAIDWQKKAIEYRKQKEKKRGDAKPYLGLVETLKKMESGMATWPISK